VLIPIGTRVRRTGFKPDHYHGRVGTVVARNLNEANPKGCRYNRVHFDGDRTWTEWVEGHQGVVPLGAVDQLGEIVASC
jgi:hypothetical protein